MRLLFGILIALVFATRPAAPAFLEPLLGTGRPGAQADVQCLDESDGVKCSATIWMRERGDQDENM